MSPSWLDSAWKERLRGQLEPVLKSPELESEISTYRGVPFALFAYPPTAERELRREVQNLATRVDQATGRRVHILSMATLKRRAIEAAFGSMERFYDSERRHRDRPTRERLTLLNDQLEQVLSDPEMLSIPQQVEKFADDLGPGSSMLFLTRIGALYPAYRASALLENLMGKVPVPTVLFYPGTRSGKHSLRFMDSLDAVHGYRHKIY